MYLILPALLYMKHIFITHSHGNLWLQVLELSIMTQATRNLNRRIICTCMPDSLDSFRQTDVVRLELVEAPCNQQGRNIQCPVKEFP